jgi:hypothetical protein
MYANSQNTSRLFSTVLSHLVATLGLLGLLALGLAPSPAFAQSPTPVTSILNGGSGTTLEVNYSGGLLAPGKFADLSNYSAPNDSIPAEGAGVRMMWYPEKAAFRAGQVGVNEDGTQWDASKVGTHSVAFGVDTEASGAASMAVGSGAVASGNRSLAIGFQSTADGGSGLVVGRGARVDSRSSVAMGFQTRVVGDYSAAIGRSTEAATNTSLSIGFCNNANSGSSGDGTLFAAGNGTPIGSSGSCNRRSDALVLKKSGDLAVGHSDPAARMHVQESVKESGGTNLGRHVAAVENTNPNDGADILGLKSTVNDPGGFTNFISFIDADEQVGEIEGTGDGGITLSSASADYAEELPVVDGASKPEPADLVGVRGGEVSLQTNRAGRVMIASSAPIMTGNATPGTEADDGRRVAVAFVGQVPAKVRGSVEVGDLIVASGENDGTGIAVSPSEYRRSTHGPIAGQAWSAKESSKVGEVTVAVGLGRSGAVAERMEDQRDRIDELEAENQAMRKRQQKIKKRLAALEAGHSPSAVAGMTGSTARLLLAFLLGGLFGAGLLWRRRA